MRVAGYFCKKGPVMALNISVNLMSTVSPPKQAQSTANIAAAGADVNAIQPAGASADTRGASTGSGADTGHGSAYQKSAKRQPDSAEPKSVIRAQAQADADSRTSAAREMDIVRNKALIDGIAATHTPVDELSERPNKVDRYAPPDPLPTAPILKTPAPKPVWTVPE